MASPPLRRILSAVAALSALASVSASAPPPPYALPPLSGTRQPLSVRGGSTDIRGGAAARDLPTNGVPRVAFQGEPGAYSEKALRDLLGPTPISVACASFEDAFRAVANRHVDYAIVPIENSLGGSIHTNYDLLLRYELHIVAEHELRVEHCLLAPPDVELEDIKFANSHPQALAQCDGKLRQLGIVPEARADTAGSAKEIMEKGLKDHAAIASELAASHYKMKILQRNLEDDENNFTRFIVLSRSPVSSQLNPKHPTKTSIVFLCPSVPGALYKALAAFALRDIDLSKVESRQASAALLQYLQFKAGGGIGDEPSEALSGPRFRYCFYIDFDSAESDERTQSALFQLREQSQFVRVLGSFPRGSRLVGPLAKMRSDAKAASGEAAAVAAQGTEQLDMSPARPLKIGIVGFGKFGQFLAATFSKHAQVIACDVEDRSAAAEKLGVEFHRMKPHDMATFFKANPDVVLFSVSVLAFEDVLRSTPAAGLAGKLVVDVCSVKRHPKKLFLDLLPQNSDILCTHPIFGPDSARHSWLGLPMMYDRLRVADPSRCAQFLSIFERERCNMIEMPCELHDKYSASSQFTSHLIGRMCSTQGFQQTPIDSVGVQSMFRLIDTTSKDSFDLFYSLFKFNEHSYEQLAKMRDTLAALERQLAAKEAYLAAKAELGSGERAGVLAEVRSLMAEAASGGAGGE